MKQLSFFDCIINHELENQIWSIGKHFGVEIKSIEKCCYSYLKQHSFNKNVFILNKSLCYVAVAV